MWEEENKPIRHPGLDPGPLSASATPAARDPGFRRDDEETETLHPHIRPFGHRVTLTIAPAKETHRQCSAQTGYDPGRCAPLGGFGWGVKAGVGCIQQPSVWHQAATNSGASATTPAAQPPQGRPAAAPYGA